MILKVNYSCIDKMTKVESELNIPTFSTDLGISKKCVNIANNLCLDTKVCIDQFLIIDK